MSVQQLTLQQTAEIVNDLAAGKVTAVISARRKVPIGIVWELRDEYGPDVASLTGASREFARRLRGEPAALPTRKPAASAAEPAAETPPRRAANDDEGTVVLDGPVNVLLLACDECGQNLWGDSTLDEAGQRAAVTAHLDNHPKPEPGPEPEPGVEPEPEPVAVVAAEESVPDASSEDAGQDAGLAGDIGVNPIQLDVTPAASGWLAMVPRTVELLLTEAAKVPSPRVVELLDAARSAIAALTDAMDSWVAVGEQRAAIRHELDVLGRRQDELVEKLARLAAEFGADPDDSPLLATGSGEAAQARAEVRQAGVAADAAQLVSADLDPAEPVPNCSEESGAMPFATRRALTSSSSFETFAVVVVIVMTLVSGLVRSAIFAFASSSWASM